MEYDFGWDTAIKERNEWLELCNSVITSDRTFIQHLQSIKRTSLNPVTHESIDLVFSALNLFETLSDEDKVTVTLMGW